MGRVLRRVLHGDVSAVACVLYLLPADARDAALGRIFAEAAAAQCYLRRTGSKHPLWGDGSLMSAALARPCASEPFLDDREYASCMGLVFEALVARA